MRNRLFDSWFAYANDKEQYVIMVANIQDLEGVDNYAAMILRKDNPAFLSNCQKQNLYQAHQQGGPIPHNLARALMPRQPYSVAVLSTGGRLHPLSPEGKGAWGKRWSPL